ncbi:MAG: hypothetical protein ACRC33_09860 [Gemmataceae bacterium]
MLIDRTHRWWSVATLAVALAALGLHLWLRPSGGGTAAGLWYGVAGSALMVFAGLLSAHRRLPVRRWVGKRQTWLRGHIWLGLLSVVFIGCHANWRLGGPLEIALWAVFALTVVSGLIGLGLQIVLPRVLTNRVDAEAPYDQIPHLCDRMRQDADAAVAPALPGVEPPARAELEALHAVARRFLGRAYEPSSPLAQPLRAEALFDRVRAVPGMEAAAAAVDRLEVLCDERRQLGDQAWVQAWLHCWLFAHVPVSLALLVLGVAHAVLSVYW